MRLPDFIMIGAAKAGTTTLYEYLCRHPQLFMCDPKEPEFFARPHVYERGLDWYASLFEGARPDQIVGEASTIYTNYPFWPDPAPRIAQTVPRAKLIYVLREPVSRAYSAYAQEMKNKQFAGEFTAIPATFEKRLSEVAYYVDSSDYKLQMEQYLRHYPRQSLKVLLFEDLIADPGSVSRDVLDFLGADVSVDLTEQGEVLANVAAAQMADYSRGQLATRLKTVPGVTALKNVLPRSVRQKGIDLLHKSPLGKKVHEAVTPPPMQPDTRRRLIEHFAPKVDELERFLGIDLGVWRKAWSKPRG